MNKDIRELIEILKRGKFEDPAEKIELLAAALKEGAGVETEFLLTLLRAPQSPLKQAAIEACRNRREKELLDELKKLAGDSDSRARLKLAELCPSLPEDFDDILRSLAYDSDYEVRYAAVKSTTGKKQFVELQREILNSDTSSWIKLGAAEALENSEQPEIVGDYFHCLANEDYNQLVLKCAEVLEKRLAKDLKLHEPFLPTDIATIEKAKESILNNRLQKLPILTEWIQEKTKFQVNPEELAKYGTDLTPSALAGTLPVAYGTEEICDQILQILFGQAPRSVVLLGPAGVGKTAIVNALASRLAKQSEGWHVLRMSPTEFISGTRYIGEWQTRVSKLIETISKPRKILLYVPGISDLIGVGSYDGSDADVTSVLMPYMEDCKITIIGESTAEEYEKGLGSVPSVRRLFESVIVKEPSKEATRALLSNIRDEASIEISDSCLDFLLEVSGQYINHSARPGSAADLLREVIAMQVDTKQPATARSILNAVSKSTGIPADLLDDSIPLELHSAKQFFENRVMGQPEAVAAVLDLITLIKAGLTDPNKPFGVMLFVGPTGVGKTELARALAEYVFGDASRLLRFDMSEYASYEGFERLIGTAGKSGTLTDAVKRSPFSVVLLDEIEKSHVNAFDLCLQLFDAGRLTDGKGKTVNFRQTIIIMTSNVGTGSSGTIMGFGSSNQSEPIREADKERTFRELSRVFRPEFLNRVDRIINFRPLTMQIAESIARRETNNVLDRSGVTRRNLVVDIDPSVISLLVKEGYSPSFGARPLKRAVEEHMLLPLARAIATGRVTNKTVLRAIASESKVEFKTISVPAEARAPKEPKLDGSLMDMATTMLTQLEELLVATEPLAERKSELLDETHKSEFYLDKPRVTETFGEIHRLDQYLSTLDGLTKAINGVHKKVNGKYQKSEEKSLLERLVQLQNELNHLQFIANSGNTRDLSDALLVVRLVSQEGNQLNGVDTLVKMYTAFAQRRRLSAEVLAEYTANNEETVTLQIAGMGAFLLLRTEAGLHQLEQRKKTKSARSGKEVYSIDSEVIRVDVFPMGNSPSKSYCSQLKTTAIQARKQHTMFLKKPYFDISIFHDKSVRSFRGLVTGEREDAINTAQLIFHTCTNEPLHTASNDIVRVYELGTGAKVKDTRTQKISNRVETVLQGNLDQFLGEQSTLDENTTLKI